VAVEGLVNGSDVFPLLLYPVSLDFYLHSRTRLMANFLRFIDLFSSSATSLSSPHIIVMRRHHYCSFLCLYRSSESMKIVQCPKVRLLTCNWSITIEFGSLGSIVYFVWRRFFFTVIASLCYSTLFTLQTHHHWDGSSGYQPLVPC
jgi:hypothetical protein